MKAPQLPPPGPGESVGEMDSEDISRNMSRSMLDQSIDNPKSSHEKKKPIIIDTNWAIKREIKESEEEEDE